MQTAQEAVDRALEVLVNRRQNGVEDSVAIQQAVLVLSLNASVGLTTELTFGDSSKYGRSWP